jgi:hypothetical protein
MPLITALIILAAFGLCLWLIVTYIPMNATIKRIIIVVAVICIVFWLLNITGLLGSAKQITVPHT